MSITKVLFRISYVFAMLGGLIAVAGGWLLGQPTVGANIGAGLLIMGATALVSVAVVTCVSAWITAFVSKSKSARER